MKNAINPALQFSVFIVAIRAVIKFLSSCSISQKFIVPPLAFHFDHPEHDSKVLNHNRCYGLWPLMTALAISLFGYLSTHVNFKLLFCLCPGQHLNPQRQRYSVVRQIIRYTLTLYVPRVTNINFLLTVSINNQEKR